MPRTRRHSARGTRRSSGIESGVSFATNPSGVTIGSVGIDAGSGTIILAELNYLNGSAGYIVGNPTAGKLMVSGVSYWAGATLSIVTGLTALETFIPTIIQGVVSTNPLTVYASKINTIAGRCSVAMRYEMGVSAGAPAMAGCSIGWIAIGT